ncbi:MAG: hypothetical protein GVY19_05845 [Bacteroidetes bacterium]|jgi:hypothetical protein|nr:hypothetical protein [Bacteroidota bacterium]
MATAFIIPVFLLITIIGALPFGLVNLTVLDVSYHRGTVPAMKIAHGAAWIEIAFGITALLAGNFLGMGMEKYHAIQQLAIAIPLLVGLIFLLNKSKTTVHSAFKTKGFLRGVLLNLISVQVFLYWIFAITYLSGLGLLEINRAVLLLSVPSIWLGKIGVLWLYARFSKPILSRSDYLAKNINRLIGIVLIASGLLQLLKYNS